MEPLKIRLDSKIRMTEAEMPQHLVQRLMQVLTFRNPRYEREAAYLRRQGKGEKPKVKPFLHGWYNLEDDFVLHRGFGPGLVRMLQEMRIPFQVADNSCVGEEAPVVFVGDLKQGKGAALTELMKKRMGLLVGMPGTGKMETACAWIGERRRKALVIVKSRAQLYAWEQGIRKYLTADGDLVGLVGDGRKETEAHVTVGIDRSLYKVAPSLLYRLGAVVLDHADRANVKLLRDLVGTFPAMYFLGLAENLQRPLIGYIMSFTGPGLFRLDWNGNRKQESEVKIIPTGFQYAYAGEGDYGKLVTALTRNGVRNQRILDDLHAETAQMARRAVVLSERVEQLEWIAEMLVQRDAAVISSRTSDTALADIHRRYQHGKLQILLCVAQSAERLELKRMDRLFVVSPVGNGSTLARLAGMMNGDGGEIWEYRDDVNVLKAGVNKRVRIYRGMGARVV